MGEQLINRTVFLDDTNPLSPVILDVFVPDDLILNYVRVNYQGKRIAVRPVLAGNDLYWERYTSTIYNRGEVL